MSQKNEKNPVLSASFRMSTEQIINKFLESEDEQLELPASLSSDQRNFVYNYVYIFGLRAKSVGKGI